MEPLNPTASTGVLDEVHNHESVENAVAEAAEQAAESVAAVPPDATNTGRRHIHLRIPLRWMAIGALAAVLAGLGGWFGWTTIQHHQREAAAAQAMDTAKKYALTLCNIDPDTVDQNFTELFDSSTEEFNDAHATRAGTLRQLLIDKKVVAHGSIADANVESVTPDKVTVALLVDQTITSTDTPNPEEEHTHIRMTLQKVDGRWLASDVKLR